VGTAAIVTLTTDFGTRDSYVAEMKGVILGIAPGVQLVDVTHDVPAHDILEAALTLEAAARTFPPGTIHVAVVDPGVGTNRRGLAIAAGDQVLVGPDNGLFTPFLTGSAWRAFEVVSEAYRRASVSRTFHGRDVFAPAAGHLALGVEPARLGPPVTDPVRLRWPGVRRMGTGVVGEVIHVDGFGNLVTSIPAGAVDDCGQAATVRVGGRTLWLVGTFGDLAPGAPGALVGSRGRLEVVVREGSAAATLKARRGTPVRLSPGSPTRKPRPSGCS
jgi:S-adenosyl-L-methionine hydrolase (adenosine-forming)